MTPLAIDYLNLLSPITDPLKWLLVSIQGATGLTWAWSIIALTVVVRLALVPLTVKQQQSMRRMQAIQPELKKLQAKHRGNRQAMNEEVMKFYKEKNVNPFGSCLPMLVQIPIFIGLFWVLQDIKTDIGDDDPSFLGGFVPDITFYLRDIPTTSLVVLMVVYVGSQIGSTILLPSSVDPRQKYLFMALPVVFAFFIINQSFPAGLLLYWITSNLWTVGQAATIRKYYPPIPVEPGERQSLREMFRQATNPGGSDEKSGGKPGEAGPPAKVARPAPKPPAKARRPGAAKATATQQESEHPSAAPAGTREAVMSERQSVEAIGETVGEAKWTAVRELERRVPGLDRAAVEFQVLSEGERGLMGVGREPARVVASVTASGPAAPPAAAPSRPSRGAGDSRGQRSRGRDRGDAPRSPRAERPRDASPPTEPEAIGPRADQVRDFVSGVCGAVVPGVGVHVRESEDQFIATLYGGDLGPLIGKHGHTMDAVHYLTNAILCRETPPINVIVDAQGYRQRRETLLRETAERVALRVRTTGRPESLEPMTSAERKVVHTILADEPGIQTASEGREPRRFIVVSPAS